jgi:hypothetical protein
MGKLIETESIPPGIMADLDYAIQLFMAGKTDPEFAARIRSESDRITEEIRKKHGVLDIAVDLVRETRDEG